MNERICWASGWAMRGRNDHAATRQRRLARRQQFRELSGNFGVSRSNSLWALIWVIKDNNQDGRANVCTTTETSRNAPQRSKNKHWTIKGGDERAYSTSPCANQSEQRAQNQEFLLYVRDRHDVQESFDHLLSYHLTLSFKSQPRGKRLISVS